MVQCDITIARGRSIPPRPHCGGKNRGGMRASPELCASRMTGGFSLLISHSVRVGFQFRVMLTTPRSVLVSLRERLPARSQQLDWEKINPSNCCLGLPPADVLGKERDTWGLGIELLAL